MEIYLLLFCLHEADGNFEMGLTCKNSVGDMVKSWEGAMLEW